MGPGVHMMNTGVGAKLLTFVFNTYKQMPNPP